VKIINYYLYQQKYFSKVTNKVFQSDSPNCYLNKPYLVENIDLYC